MHWGQLSVETCGHFMVVLSLLIFKRPWQLSRWAFFSAKFNTDCNLKKNAWWRYLWWRFCSQITPYTNGTNFHRVKKINPLKSRISTKSTVHIFEGIKNQNIFTEKWSHLCLDHTPGKVFLLLPNPLVMILCKNWNIQKSVLNKLCKSYE